MRLRREYAIGFTVSSSPLQSLWTEGQNAASQESAAGTATGRRLWLSYRQQERDRRRRLVTDCYERAIDVFRREALPNELMTWEDGDIQPGLYTVAKRLVDHFVLDQCRQNLGMRGARPPSRIETSSLWTVSCEKMRQF